MENEQTDELSTEEVIIQILNKIEKTFEDGFVPQSKLWELVSQNQPGYEIQSSGNKLWRSFLTSLSGKKNSFSLFESCEDPETGEIKWRLRSKNQHSHSIGSHTKNERMQIEELQQTVRTLRMQTMLLESDNRNYRNIIEHLKREASPDVQKNFDFYETLYGFIQNFERSFKEADEKMNQIDSKIPDFK